MNENMQKIKRNDFECCNSTFFLVNYSKKQSRSQCKKDKWLFVYSTQVWLVKAKHQLVQLCSGCWLLQTNVKSGFSDEKMLCVQMVCVTKQLYIFCLKCVAFLYLIENLIVLSATSKFYFLLKSKTHTKIRQTAK